MLRSSRLRTHLRRCWITATYLGCLDITLYIRLMLSMVLG